MTLLHRFGLPWLKRDALFYVAFALVASLVVPVLGLFVVFVALIAPALWLRVGVPWCLSVLGTLLAGALGLFASWFLDAPSGACVALALGVWGVISTLRPRPPDLVLNQIE